MAASSNPQPVSSPLTRRLRFGDFVLDPDRLVLFHRDEERRLRLKSFEVLRFLAERPRRLVTKSELISAVWPDSFVTDNSLVQCLQEIRRALGDDSQELIKTVKGRGYILEADVAADDSSEPERPAPAVRPRSRTVAIASVLIIAAVALAVWQVPSLLTPKKIGSVAVLPFQALGTVGHDEALELGMADALITRLSTLEELTIRPTSSIRQFSGTSDPVAVGKQLRVGAVVDGSVQESGDRIRVSVRLLRVADGKPLWADTYDERFGDIFSVQDSVSKRIASALSITLSGEESSRMTGRYATNTEAYQLYLRGKLFWERRTEPDLRKAMAYFEQAVQIDPRYAPGYAALANCYGPLLQRHFFQPIEALPKMEEAIRKALEIDPNLAEAHTALAAARFNQWDFPGAERESRHSIELNPSDSLTHKWYAYYLGAVGRSQDSLTEALRGLELEPLSGGANYNLAWTLSQMGRYADALPQIKAALEVNPHYQMTRELLAEIQARMGQYTPARDEYRSQGDWMNLAGVEARAGNRDEAQANLNRFLQSYPAQRPLPQVTIACVYALLGDTGEAFRRLELAWREHDTQFLFVKSLRDLDALRRDPRFSNLLGRAGV